MINRIGRFKGRLVFSLVVFLAIPLFGWNAFPKFIIPDSDFGNGSATGIEVRQLDSAQSFSAGNVQTGQKLFMGNLHFENGGPPCMGCHNVGENGLLGGGALGPDLTNVSTRRSETEILGIFSSIGPVTSPVMQPIYGDAPLTAEEQADLLAFIKSSAGQPEANRELLVIGISVAGFVAAVVLLGFVYRSRLRSVRRSLVKKAQAEL